jgi:hypothetical protein
VILLVLRCASLALGPLLLATSTFFWEDGRYGVTGGTLVALSSAAWVYGLIGAWERLVPRLPVVATAGLVLTLLGTLGGIAFGLQGFFEGTFEVSATESLTAVGEHPVATWLILWGPGPLFPLSLVLLGASLLWARLVPPSRSAGSPASTSWPTPSTRSCSARRPGWRRGSRGFGHQETPRGQRGREWIRRRRPPAG